MKRWLEASPSRRCEDSHVVKFSQQPSGSGLRRSIQGPMQPRVHSGTRRHSAVEPAWVLAVSTREVTIKVPKEKKKVSAGSIFLEISAPQKISHYGFNSTSSVPQHSPPEAAQRRRDPIGPAALGRRVSSAQVGPLRLHASQSPRIQPSRRARRRLEVRSCCCAGRFPPPRLAQLTDTALQSSHPLCLALGPVLVRPRPHPRRARQPGRRQPHPGNLRLQTKIRHPPRHR